ncbi:HAD hydrolase-like protein [Radiobacillus kanasensis]|uniref:HAD hydrolase-like protein n=1 Tax=Radiobacillus kanasensis TaxID=2844358 RepID=UPI001E341B4C|nr:HAD hydrolase-like protein [Radiobacillus kanasensis]UFU01083.1 HAD hydrolase-like protein [Radiobacillus kanasensis]
MVKYVLFDFDGTLADSRNVFISAWNQLSDEYRFKKIRHEDLDELRGMTIKERSKRLNFPMVKMPVVLSKLYQCYQKSIDDILLYDGVKELLETLEKEGYQLAVLSSNKEDVIKAFLQKHQINSIPTIVCSSKIFGKDRLMKKFMRDHKVRASQILYIGDEHRDIVACRKTGIKVAWVSWGYDSMEVVKREKPDFIVNKPEDILQII